MCVVCKGEVEVRADGWDRVIAMQGGWTVAVTATRGVEGHSLACREMIRHRLPVNICSVCVSV